MTENNQSEISESTFEIRRGLWDSKPRLLRIHRDFLEFEDKDLLVDINTRFNREEISGYRFGINWINGYEFTIGREFQVHIRNKEQNVLKIHFKSLYGYKKKELSYQFAKIIDELWNYYFNEITEQYLEAFRNGAEIEIEKIRVNDSGLALASKTIIPWNQVGTKDYQTYFAIYSLEDPAKINKTFSYLQDWNIVIIYSVVRTILTDKNLLNN